MNPDDDRTIPICRHRSRLIAATVLTGIGACEAVTTTPLIDLGRAPDWLALPVAMTGFIAFVGLAGIFGNCLVAIGSLILLRRRWHWPSWAALIVSLPFWIVTYQVCPKPW